MVIYVPDYTSNNCAYIYSTDIIRVYESTPSPGNTVAFKDYYIKSSYMYNTGTTTFNQYSTLPTCISSDRITTDVYYRNDFPQILFIFLALAFICFWIPWRLVLRIFRRYQ